MKMSPASPAERGRLTALGLSGGAAASALRLTFERGELLYREGLPAAYFMLLEKGRAKVTISAPGGRKLLLSFCESGACLGVVELPLGLDATSGVEAVERTVCLALPLARCRSAMEESSAFARYIACALAQIVNRSSRNAAVNLLSSLRERLCAYIDSTQRDGCFCEQYTQLAELLGVSCRHLFRELNKLCKSGVLQKEAHRYRILDRRALTALASDCYLSR